MPTPEPKPLSAPVRRLLAYLSDPAAPRRLIALAGLPGSGKSTVAQRWTHRVNEAHRVATSANANVASNVAFAGMSAASAHPTATAMVTLSMDGFHLTKAELARFADPAEAFKRRGAPWTFDAAGFAERLQALRAPKANGANPATGARNAPVNWPGFEHGVGDPVADAVVVDPATRIVLVEGLYLLHQNHGWNHAHYFDECWFLDVPMGVAMERLVKRHITSNHQTLEVAEARVDDNDRFNAEMVWESRGRAHWLVGE